VSAGCGADCFAESLEFAVDAILCRELARTAVDEEDIDVFGKTPGIKFQLSKARAPLKMTCARGEEMIRRPRE